MKEIRSLLVVVKEIDGGQGVSMEGRVHGKIEEIFQQLHGAPPDFAENPDLFDACHNPLCEFNDGLVIVIISFRGASP